MDKYGLTVRKIRKDKGFLQKEIYENVLAKSFAIRFEKGEVSLKYETLLLVLAKLNVTLEEFHYIHNDYQLDKPDTIWEEFTLAVSSKSSRRLLAFYEKHAKSDVTFNLLLSYLAHVVAIIDQLGLKKSLAHWPEKELTFVESYFLSRINWTIDEMNLLTNFFPIFSLTVQKQLVSSCYGSMRLYSEYQGHLKRVTDLLSRYILHCYALGEFKEGNRWYIKLQSLPTDKENLYARLRSDLCGGYYYYLKGEYSQGQNLVDDVCLALTLVGYEREAKIYRQDFKRFQTTHSIL